jgi:hypothetical protein
MEMHVFFRGKPPAKAALARTLRQLGFPLTIPDAKGSLTKQSGYLPMKLRREETGVEFDIFEDRAAIAEYTTRGIDLSYERVANFRWGSDSQECIAALCSAAALAKLTGGVVFEETEGKVLSVPEAIAAARKALDTLPGPDEPRRPGTRPTDIKRYLRPLLELRSDLVLRGRHLLIRPVRHLLRGAFFDRSSDKYRFGLWQYIAPLCDTSQMGIALGEEIWCPDNEVWQPHFAPLLFDQLAEDIFDSVGRIISFTELAQELEPIGRFYRFHSTRMIALILSGQPDRAAEYMAALEQKPNSRPEWKTDIQHLCRLLDRDIATVCAEYHAKEEKAAAALKLGDLWEPSPFPAELPETERKSRSSEAVFITSPWVAKPTWLVQEAPEHPGEVRFATIVHHRQDQPILLVALTREEAEQRHHNRERYVLATRLPEGQQLVLYHSPIGSSQNPDRPKIPHYVPSRNYYLWMHCTSAIILTVFHRNFDEPDGLEVSSVSVRNHKNREIWHALNNFGKCEKSIYDHRVDRDSREDRLLAESDRALCQFETPPFGEFEDFLRRMIEYLKKEGFGALPR